MSIERDSILDLDTHYTGKILVTRVKLILLPTSGDSGGFIVRLSSGKLVTPVLVSTKTAVKEGELAAWWDSGSENWKSGFIGTDIILDKKELDLNPIFYKVLVTQNNFSVAQLTAIQEGKMKDGMEVYLQCAVRGLTFVQSEVKEGRDSQWLPIPAVYDIFFNYKKYIKLHPISSRSFSIHDLIEVRNFGLSLEGSEFNEWFNNKYKLELDEIDI